MLARLSRLWVLALCVCLCPSAAAQMPTEGEAVERGTQALRERRWDDAVCAFAQSAKELPGPLVHSPLTDRRSRALVGALEQILRDLEARGASDAEKLPYWDFAWQGFPFFGTRLGELIEMSQERWREIAGAAARARLSALNPAGSDPRFAVCRDLAAMPDDAGSAAVLSLLDSVGAHADCGVCPWHAYRLLRDDMDDPRVRATHDRHLTDSPFVGLVADNSSPESSSAEWERIRNPIGRRWLILSALEDDAIELRGGSAPLFQQLAECGAPWILPEEARAWAQRAALMREQYLVADLDRRLEELLAGPVTAETGWTCLWVTIRRFERGDDPSAALRLPYVKAWEARLPNDPALAWGRAFLLYLLLEGDPAARLSELQRALLSRIEEDAPGEVLGWFAASVLAEDETRRGQGERARQRYESILRADPAGIRQRTPLPAQAIQDTARMWLMEYELEHDPGRCRRLHDAIRWRWYSVFGPWREEWTCFTGAMEDAAAGLRWRALNSADEGAVEPALESLWKEMTADDGKMRFDPAGAAFSFAEICAIHGLDARLREALAKLRAAPQLRKDFSGEERGSPEAEAAFVLERFLAGWEAGRRPDADALLRHLRESARAHEHGPWLRGLSFGPGLAAAVSPRLRPEEGDAAALLATVVEGPEALAQLAWGALYGSDDTRNAASLAIADRGLPAWRVLFRTVRTGSVGAWDFSYGWQHSMSSRAEQDVARLFAELAGDPDPAVREFAGAWIEALRRDGPWEAYCASGEWTDRRAPANTIPSAQEPAQPPGVRWFGRVRDLRTGAPLAGARVRARELDATLLHRADEPIAEAVAGADGSFAISLPAARAATLQADAAGHASLAIEVPRAEQACRVDFTLTPGIGFAGRVVDASGAGVDGARVVVYAPGCPSWNVPRHMAPRGTVLVLATDVDGRFRVEGCAAGDVEYDVRSDGRGGALGSWRVLGGESLELALHPPRTVVVHVRTAEGSPAPGARVELLAPDQGVRAEIAGADGTAVFRDASPGALEARVARDGKIATVTIDAGDSADLVLDADAGGVEVTGTLCDATGRPAAGVEVGLDRQVLGLTDDRGGFRLRRVAAGEYALFVPGSEVEPEKLVVAAGEDVAGLDLRTTGNAWIVRGTLRAPDGLPAAGSVAVLAVSGQSFRGIVHGMAEMDDFPPWPGIVLDGEGAFALRGCTSRWSEDRWGQVVAFHPEYGWVRSPAFNLADRHEHGPYELRFPERTDLSVRVLDSAGHPIAAAAVTSDLRDRTGEPLWPWRAGEFERPPRTDRDGTVLLRVLPPGRTGIRVAIPPCRTPATGQVLWVEEGSGCMHLEIRLLPPREAEGRLLDEAGHPVAASLEAEGGSDRFHGTSSSGADGAFRFTGIPADVLRLRVHRPGTGDEDGLESAWLPVDGFVHDLVLRRLR